MGSKRRQNIRRKRKMDRLRNRNGRSWRFIFGICAAAVLGLFVIAFVYFSLNAKYEYSIEAGEAFKVESLWNGFVGETKLADGGKLPDTKVPGTYKVKVKLGFISFTSSVTVKDTAAPTAEPAAKTVVYGETCSAAAFAENVQDATEVKISYETEPNFNHTGTQEVKIILEDLGGNRTQLTSTLEIPNVRMVLQLEAGEPFPQAAAFLVNEGTAEFVSDTSGIDLTKTGDSAVQVRIDGVVYNVIVRVRDNIPPQGQAVPVLGRTGKRIEASAFVTGVVDETQVTVSYQTEPNFEQEGEQTVIIVLTDLGGNTTVLESKLTLNKDNQPPVISGTSITIGVGGNISYKKNVTAIDNYDKAEEISLKFDNSGVNLKQIGVYVVRCTATDTAGNKAEKDISVNVLDQGTTQVEEATVNGLADEVLNSLLYDGMSLYDKAHAIYLWVTNNVEYILHSEKMSWTEGAYEGLHKLTGDCFVFAATSKILLTRAGIQNMDITKSTSKPRSHYWNLINIGDGWYHFDTTPRSDNDEFFMATDARLKAYSDSHSGSHKFDRSLYPPIN